MEGLEAAALDRSVGRVGQRDPVIVDLVRRIEAVQQGLECSFGAALLRLNSALVREVRSPH